MTDYTEEELNELVFKAIVPKGLRPETEEEINDMLDVMEDEPLPEDTIQRMLRKIRGEEPLGKRQEMHEPDSADIHAVDLPEEEAVLYRNQTDDLPPEVEQVLQDMEDEALEDSEDDTDEDEVDDPDA